MNNRMMVLGAGIVLVTTGCAAVVSQDGFAGYKTCERPEMRDLDAFENADFEDSTKYGLSKDGHAEIGRFGYNGNGGARVRPCPKQAYSYVLKTKPGLELKKGQRYVLSAYIRLHGEITCQTCADVWFRVKPRKYAFGVYGPAIEPLSDGWVRHTVEFVPKWDDKDLDYEFKIYCRTKNGEDFSSRDNYVEVDNVAIHTAAPKWYLCNTWPTHNRIFAETGRVRVHSAFLGEYVEKGAEAVYACEFVGRDGLCAVRSGGCGRVVCIADANGNFTVDFGKLDYRGPVTLRVTLYDRTHKLNLGMRELDVTVASTPDMTKGLFVKENGIVLKDGKPYMPVGFYTDFAYPKHAKEAVEANMRKMRDAGFDAMIDYGTYALNDKRRDWYYGACAKYGISVLNDDFKACGPAINTVDRDMPKYRAAAERDLKYPALIGYYIMDEGTESFVEPLTKIRRMLNEVAPERMVNICNIMRPFPYLPCADIQGGDNYPINKGRDLTSCEARVRGMAEMAPAAIWFAPQAYNWASMVSGALTNAALYAQSGREPNENETLSVALLMASYDVKGFFFYSYYDVFRCPIKEWIPKRWEYVCKAGKCLRDLEPFLMSGERIVEVPHVDKKGRTRVVALSDGKGTWRVLVIGIEKDHETTFILPAEYGALKSRCGKVTCESGTYTFTGKDFSCDILQ